VATFDTARSSGHPLGITIYPDRVNLSMMNMFWEPLDFEVPAGGTWQTAIDHIRPESRRQCRSRRGDAAGPWSMLGTGREHRRPRESGIGDDDLIPSTLDRAGAAPLLAGSVAHRYRYRRRCGSADPVAGNGAALCVERDRHQPVGRCRACRSVRHVLVLLGAGLVTGAGQIVLRQLSSGNGIDTTAAIWFHAGRDARPAYVGLAQCFR